MFSALQGFLILFCGVLDSYKVFARKCDKNEIEAAMMACQEPREALSDASLLNNNTLLCQALQVYASCIEPEISGCKGKAVVAFQVIKQTYMGPPYNCKVTDNAPDQDNVEGQAVENDGAFVGVTVAMIPTEKAAATNLPDSTTQKPEIQPTNTAVPSFFVASNMNGIMLILGSVSTCMLHLLSLTLLVL